MKYRVCLSASLLLTACSGGSDRYKDTQHLELPPTLAVEHRAASVDQEAETKRSSSSALVGLMAFTDDDKQPTLSLKTRMERAWEIVITSIKVTDIILLDQSREDGKIEVMYDADLNGEEVGFFKELMNNRYDETRYTITLKARRTNEILVETAPTKPDDVSAEEDGSVQLKRLLAKTIEGKILNREGRPRPESD